MDFQKFLKENRNKIIKHAKSCEKYDKDENYIISKNDDWAEENEWDEMYLKLKEEEKKCR